MLTVLYYKEEVRAEEQLLAIVREKIACIYTFSHTLPVYVFSNLWLRENLEAPYLSLLWGNSKFQTHIYISPLGFVYPHVTIDILAYLRSGNAMAGLKY